jgi:hypothetical protein
VITDLAFNPLVHGSQASFLGWSPSYAEFDEPEEVMDLDIYRFLIKPIRDADQKDGGEFLWRYLRGAQALWELIQQRAQKIKDLWSVTDIEDEFLPYLKNIVGWTSELDHITEGLTALQLRRLINASIPLWRKRGTEPTLLDVLQLATGERLRLYNWFDRRFMLDDIYLGELDQGQDPWLLSLPGYSDRDEYRMAVRIVDSGSINRDIVRGLTILMRPSLERIWIYYTKFLDRFLLDGDNSQWAYPASESLVVSNYSAKLEDDAANEIAYVSTPGADDWYNYVSAARVRGTTTNPGDYFGVAVMYADDENYYAAWLDVQNNRLVLENVEAGVSSFLAQYDFGTELQTLHDSVWYVLRVHAFEEGSAVRLQVHVDGDQKINTTDSAHTRGGPALLHSVGATLECNLIEVMGVPVDRELVDINQRY